MDTKQHKPVLIVIAGPNGFGKTTITSRVLQHDWLEDSLYINPDNVAQHMFGDRNNQDAIQKGILPSPKGANVNNRWWNDRREWNLRIAYTLPQRPQRGRTETRLDVVRPLWGRFLPPDDYPQVSFPSVIPPAVIESWPPLGTGGYLQKLNTPSLSYTTSQHGGNQQET